MKKEERKKVKKEGKEKMEIKENEKEGEIK